MNYEEKLTFYTRNKVRRVLQNGHYRNFELTDGTRATFGECASETVRRFLRIFTAYKNSCISEKNVDICCKYLFDDKQTVAELAEEYRDTENALREIISEYTRKLRYAFNYRNDYLGEIDGVLNKIPEDGLIHFIAFGFLAQYSRRMTLFILQCLFNDLADSLIAAADQVLCNASDVRDEEMENLISKACFPNGVCPKINFNDIEDDGEPAEYSGQEKMFFRFSQCGEVKKIIRYPKIVYYRSKNTEHKPACCLQTKDNKIILVVLIPVINMAVHYNLKRFRALHAFCKENGLGYIVTDSKLNAITDIKNLKVNGSLSRMLFEILGEFGRITKADVDWLRERYNFTEKAIAAFVIQNKLKFTVNPYVITYNE